MSPASGAHPSGAPARRARWIDAARWRASGAPPLAPRLDEDLGMGVRGVLPGATADAWARAVREARTAWTADFDGEQFALGRAFYTHLETARSAAYFADAAASDARVEAIVPGLQAWMRALLGELVGGVVRPRVGFCGAGVHVFPAAEKVAREGGVVHFDLEGLTPHQLARRARAVTLVVMVEAPRTRGGLRLWDVRWDGGDEPDPDELPRPVTMRSRAGDAVLIEAYRLHQIEPFGGDRPRLSATLHAAEVAGGVWECWF